MITGNVRTELKGRAVAFKVRDSSCKLVKDPGHPSHRLFPLLPHGKRYRSAKSRTKRLLNSFYPPSHKTPEQVTKWLPGLFALCAPPQPLFYTAATLCLSYMHSHFNYTFMYIHAHTSICLTNRCLYIVLLLFFQMSF